MVKSKQIAIFFLGVVYFMMLTAILLPHHHHEESACYTSTHCEESVNDHEHHAEEPLDHNHEHNTEDSQNCLTSEYYVFSDAGHSLKRTFEYTTKGPGHHYFHISCLNCAKDEPSFETVFKQSGILPILNTYTASISCELPMRAPPALIT